MKLDRSGGLFGLIVCVTALLVAAAAGCAPRAPSPVAPTAPAPVVTPREPVGTATVRSAELETDVAPKVGKSQRSEPGLDDAQQQQEEDEAPKPAPRRHAPRAGGGFSGYK